MDHIASNCIHLSPSMFLHCDRCLRIATRVINLSAQIMETFEDILNFGASQEDLDRQVSHEPRMCA